MGEVVVMKTKRAPYGEIVTRDRSYEWGNVWGYLPDPDPILLKAGVSAEVLTNCLADAHVLACYQSRKAGVINAEFKLVYPKGSEGLAVYFDSLMDTLPVYDIIAQMLDAPFYGFSVNEVIWRDQNGKWVPTEIAQKPNEWFVWDKLNRLRFLSRFNQLEGEVLPNYKFLVARHFPSFQNPYGVRILSRCIWPVTFKKGGFKFWTMFVERFGIPWSLGKVPPGTEQEAREALLQTLEKMVQSACAVINDDESIEIMETRGKSEGGGGGGVFQLLVDGCNAEISKAILTQTLSTEIGSKGAYLGVPKPSRRKAGTLPRWTSAWLPDVSTSFFSGALLLNFNVKSAPKFIFVEEDDAREAHSEKTPNSQTRASGLRNPITRGSTTSGPVNSPSKLRRQTLQTGLNQEDSKQKDQRVRNRQKLPNKRGNFTGKAEAHSDRMEKEGK